MVEVLPIFCSYFAMKNLLDFLLCGLLISFLNSKAVAQGERMLSKVDPLWANENGQYFSGVCSPFGMVKLGPDNPTPIYLSGYKNGGGIRGFSHTHLNTHKIEASYGHLLVIPQFGEPNFRHVQYDNVENQKMSPALFQAQLQQKQGKIEVSLTANQNAGRHKWKFLFNQAESIVSIVIDPSYCLANSPKTALKMKFFQASTDGSFSGKSTFSADNQTITIFYSGQVNVKNPTLKWKVDTARLPNKKFKLDTTAFAFSGKMGTGEEVELSLCLSFKNEEEAKESLKRMLTQSFEDIQKKAEMAWDDRLSVIQIPNSTRSKIISTALFRTMISPTDVSGNHPEDQYGEAHFWDQAHQKELATSVMPLHNLIYVPHQRRLFNSLIRTGESKNGLPEAWLFGYYGKNEGGASAEGILAEGVLKGIVTGQDAAKAWKICAKNAMEASPQPEWYGRSLVYLDQGYENGQTEFAVFRSFQLASCDFALAQMARKLDKLAEARKLEERSFKVLTLFKLAEKSAWPASLACSHLMDTLAALAGGKSEFGKKLDSLAQTPQFQNVSQLPFHLARAFLRIGDREKAESILEKFRENAGAENSLFGTQFDPGSGGMANLIFATIGLIPWPGTDEYSHFRPGIERVEMTIYGGKNLVIKGKGKKAYWNGKEIKSQTIRHADLIAGGTLEWK